MITKKNFKLEITLSKACYSRKPVRTDYERMSWVRKSIPLYDFIACIKAGYSYCHIYYNNSRKKNKFLYTQVVSIDVDKSMVSLQSFLADCTLKPTFAYETFSNCIYGPYSYRLVYVFEEKLNAKQFEEAYEKLCRLTELTDTRDHCGKVLSQLMNGTSRAAYVYQSNIIYSAISDLHLESMEEDNTCALFTETPFKINTKPHKKIAKATIGQYNPSTPNNNIYNTQINQKQYKSNDLNWKKLLEEHEEAIEILCNSREKFLDFYHQKFKVTRWSKLEYCDAGYCKIPEGHLKLFIRYGYNEGKPGIKRFKDGEKRRNRLFIDGCIIRKIRPDIQFLELLYNLVHRVYFYYDNSDGVLSEMLIVRKAYDVMSYDVDSMHFESLDAGRITTSPAYCKLHGLNRRAYCQVAVKIERYHAISEWYDPELTVA